MNKKLLLELLEEHESAPSAVHLLANTLDITLDFEPYEESEGFNDQKRDELVAQMTDEQVEALIEEIKTFSEE